MGDVVVEVQSEDGTVGVGQPLPTDLYCREDHRFSRPSSVIDVAQSCQLLTSTHNDTVFQVYLLVLVVLLLATSLNITSADLWRDR